MLPNRNENLKISLDTASGTSIDYMQDKGVPYIYGIELRPEDGDNVSGFTIPARYIKPTGKTQVANWMKSYKDVALCLYLSKKSA